MKLLSKFLGGLRKRGARRTDDHVRKATTADDTVEAQETTKQKDTPQKTNEHDFWDDLAELLEEEDDDDLLDIPDSCFSELATVRVQDSRGTVKMRDLRQGDRVATGTHDFQPIYGFARRETEQLAHFLQITTAECQRPLEISNEHLVFLHGHSDPVRADSVQVGDVLNAAQSGTIVATKVTEISSVYRKGRYSPLTPGGTLIVDGIVASCYYVPQNKTTKDELVVQGAIPFLSQHVLLHLALAPMRIVYSFMPYDRSDLSFLFYNDNDGLPIYISCCFRLAVFLHALPAGAVGRVVRAGMVCLLLLVWTIVWLLEQCLRPMHDALRLQEKSD